MTIYDKILQTFLRKLPPGSVSFRILPELIQFNVSKAYSVQMLYSNFTHE